MRALVECVVAVILAVLYNALIAVTVCHASYFKLFGAVSYA